jgi:hypothetical protein
MMGPGGTTAALWCRWHGRLARRRAAREDDRGDGGPPGEVTAVTAAMLDRTFPGYRVLESAGAVTAAWQGAGRRRDLHAGSLAALAEKMCLAERLPPGGLDGAALAAWRDTPPGAGW